MCGSDPAQHWQRFQSIWRGRPRALAGTTKSRVRRAVR